MNLQELYGTNEDAEENGVWLPLIDTLEVKIARVGNKKHAKAVARLTAPYQKMMERGKTIPDEKATEIAVTSMIEGLLKDWRGFTDENGEEIPYTPENARAVLMKFKDLRNDIAALAQDMNNFRQESLEIAAGNSGTISDGN